MKNLILLVSMMALTSCGYFESAKGPIIEKASVTAQKAAVKNLGCTTGQPVYDSVEKKLSEMLKVKDEGYKSVVKTVCLLSVEPLAEEIIKLGNGKLPESWLADGCSLDGFEDDAEKLAEKLCEKL